MAQLRDLGTLQFNKDRHGEYVRIGKLYASIRSLDTISQGIAMQCVQAMNNAPQRQHIKTHVPPREGESGEVILKRAFSKMCRYWDSDKVICFQLGALYEFTSAWCRSWADAAEFRRMEQTCLQQLRKMKEKGPLLQIDLDRMVILMIGWEGKGTIFDFLEYYDRPMVVLLVQADDYRDEESHLEQKSRLLSQTFKQPPFPTDVQIRTTICRSHDLQSSLLLYKPRIIHFLGSGHGAGLILQDATGNASKVKPEVLVNLLRLAVWDGLDTVVLNACYEEKGTELIAKTITNVISMRSKIEDPAAMTFTRSFYGALGAGESFSESFVWARASAQFEPSAADLDIVLLQGLITAPLDHQISQRPVQAAETAPISALLRDRCSQRSIPEAAPPTPVSAPLRTRQSQRSMPVPATTPIPSSASIQIKQEPIVVPTSSTNRKRKHEDLDQR